jgi:hypothetical protein
MHVPHSTAQMTATATVARQPQRLTRLVGRLFDVLICVLDILLGAAGGVCATGSANRKQGEEDEGQVLLFHYL